VGTYNFSFGQDKRTFLAYVSKTENFSPKVKEIKLKKDEISYHHEFQEERRFKIYSQEDFFRIPNNLKNAQKEQGTIEKYFAKLGKRVENKIWVDEEERKNGFKDGAVNQAGQMIVKSSDLLIELEKGYKKVRNYITIRVSPSQGLLEPSNKDGKEYGEKLLSLGTNFKMENGKLGFSSKLDYGSLFFKKNWNENKISIGKNFSFLELGYERIAGENDKIFVKYAKIL